jgi:hypothetical protein
MTPEGGYTEIREKVGSNTVTASVSGPPG